jgi:hypothetical protein
MGRLGRGDKLATIGGWPGPDVGAIDPLLSHVQEHLRLKQRDSGPRSGPKMEMESTRVEIPVVKHQKQGTRGLS